MKYRLLSPELAGGEMLLAWWRQSQRPGEPLVWMKKRIDCARDGSPWVGGGFAQVHEALN